MKKLSIILIVLTGIAIVGYSQRAAIAERLMAAVLPARMGTDQVAALEDGLHVALCGAVPSVSTVLIRRIRNSH